MAALTQLKQEVVDRFQQLTPDRQRYLMLVMFRTDPDLWRRYQREGEQQLRQLAAEKQINWDLLNDEQRQDFVDAILHEDRR